MKLCGMGVRWLSACLAGWMVAGCAAQGPRFDSVPEDQPHAVLLFDKERPIGRLGLFTERVAEVVPLAINGWIPEDMTGRDMPTPLLEIRVTPGWKAVFLAPSAQGTAHMDAVLGEMKVGYVVFRARAGERYRFSMLKLADDAMVFTVTDGRGRLVADRKVDSTVYVPDYESGYRKARALYDAAAHGNLPEMRRLLREGAEIDWAGPVGTPLIVAAMRGQAEAVQLLIEEGANVNAVNGGLPISLSCWITGSVSSVTSPVQSNRFMQYFTACPFQVDDGSLGLLDRFNRAGS